MQILKYQNEFEQKINENYISSKSGDFAQLGRLNNNSNIDCGIDLYKGSYNNDVDKNKWNDGGNGLIIDKSFSAFNTISEKELIINKILSPEACDLCDDGEKFFNTFSSLAKNDESRKSLFNTSKFICEKGSDYYNSLIAQIEKLNKDKEDSMFWESDKAIYQKALDTYWEKPNPWEGFLKTLERIQLLFETNTDLTSVNTSELFFIIDYCSIELLNQLTAEEKAKIVQFIFDNEIFITEGNILGIFSNTKDEEGLLVKIIASVKSDQAKEFLTLLRNFSNGEKNILTAMLTEVDDVMGRDHFTALNQMLFVKLIEAEGGLEQYIEKYKNLEPSFKWYQRDTFWIFIRAYLIYTANLNNNGTIDFSADFEINHTTFFGNNEKQEIDCLTEDCNNVWKTVDNNKGIYGFQNFIPPVQLKPYDVVMVEFTTGIEELGIEERTFLPIPAFFFYAVIQNNSWDILKRDLSDITTVGTSLFAGGALYKGASGFTKASAIGTLFFNTSNALVMTNDVIDWMENETTFGKAFLKGYRILNIFLNLDSLYSSSGSVETIFDFMALYFDAEGAYYDEFGLPFKEKFPNEYEKLMDELNKLK